MRLVAGRARLFFRGGPLRGAPARDSFTPPLARGRNPPPTPPPSEPPAAAPVHPSRSGATTSGSIPPCPPPSRRGACCGRRQRRLSQRAPLRPSLDGRPTHPAHARARRPCASGPVGGGGRSGRSAGWQGRKKSTEKEKHNSTGRVAHQATTPPPRPTRPMPPPSPPPSPTPTTPPRLPRPPPSDRTTAYPSALTISIHCRSPSASVSGSAATSRTTA